MINKANIILTHNCNLRCKHCYIDAKSCKENYKEIYEKTKLLIDKLKKDKINNIMFTGGECMIFPYLKELITYAKELKMKTTIFTNGMIFDKEIFNLVDSINISIDGDISTHNYIRGNKNSYQNVLKVLDYLKEIDKYTKIQYTINNLNFDKLDSLIELTNNHLNIRTVSLVFVIPEGRAKDNSIYCEKEYIDNTYKKLDELYLKTQYHIQFVPNIIDEYGFINYYLSGDLSFPLWFDIPLNKYYLLSEDIKVHQDIEKYSKENIEKEAQYYLDILKKNKNNIIKKEYIDVEKEIKNTIMGE